MMTSRADAAQAFVWVWLPGATAPVVGGRLDQEGERLLFTYGASYRRRQDAMSIYEPELPLQEGVIEPLNGLPMASCIRDGSPDAWGRRVIINRLTGKKPEAAGASDLSELTFLLQSGSDRIGALDFQESAREYVPRSAAQASLDERLRRRKRQPSLRDHDDPRLLCLAPEAQRLCLDEVASLRRTQPGAPYRNDGSRLGRNFRSLRFTREAGSSAAHTGRFDHAA